MVYGYGRLKNFEYLAIEILGKSLTDDDNNSLRIFSIPEIANIGIQMVYYFL